MKPIAIIFAIFIFSVLFAISTYCQIPETFNYQAFVTQSDGSKLNDGKYQVTFNLYDNIFSTVPIWSETQEVEIKSGYMNVILGQKTKFSSKNVKFNKPLYLGIKIGNEPEIKPYTQLTAVPYSMIAKTLDYTNAKEGDVLTFKDSTVKWDRIVTSSEPANTEVNSDKPALTLVQKGTGDVLNMIKYEKIEVTSKDKDSPLEIIGVDTVRTLGPKYGIYMNIGSPDKVGLIVKMSNYSNKEYGDAILCYNEGNGDGVNILNTEILSNSNALSAYTCGFGMAGFFAHEGMSGSAGYFTTKSVSNDNPVLLAQALNFGHAGQFVINEEKNDKSALVAYTKGGGNAISGYVDNAKGHAGSFIVQNPNNSGASLSAYSNGTTSSAGLYAKSGGKGRAASFESNPNAEEPTVFIDSKNLYALFVRADQKAPTAAVFSETIERTHNGPVVQIQSIRGKNACTIVSTENDSEPSLIVTKQGNTSQIAMRVNGSIDCNGNITKRGGSFVIDHPLDPENKLLCHSFVESPDMKNIYDGVVTLNDNGEAVVELPAWFEALNKDFRYQLTCIGGWAQVYIAEEIKNNKFKIAGGRKGLKVSWLVTGIRHDKWANENRIQVEMYKNTPKIGEDRTAPRIYEDLKPLDIQPNIDFQEVIRKHDEATKKIKKVQPVYEK